MMACMILMVHGVAAGSHRQAVRHSDHGVWKFKSGGRVSMAPRDDASQSMGVTKSGSGGRILPFLTYILSYGG
jgi:hypothetical protein